MESRSRTWVDRMVLGLLLLVAVGLLGFILVPPKIGRGPCDELADEANLRRLYEWQVAYQARHGALPSRGGYRFALAPWCSDIVEHSLENLDRLFTPGPAKSRDPDYQEFYRMVHDGENPFPSLQQAQSTCTHYVGPATPPLALGNGEEAWLADDNERGWNLRDGIVNVLFGDGRVLRYRYLDLKEQGWVTTDFDKSAPVVTWGPSSPIPPCRSLSNR